MYPPPCFTKLQSAAVLTLTASFIAIGLRIVCTLEMDVDAVLPSARCAAPVLICLFRPRASDFLKYTRNEGQHEEDRFLSASHSQHVCFHDNCSGRVVCGSQAGGSVVIHAINGSATTVVMTVKGCVFLWVLSRASCHCDERGQCSVICLYRFCAFQRHSARVTMVLTVGSGAQVHMYVQTVQQDEVHNRTRPVFHALMSLYPNVRFMYFEPLKTTASCLDAYQSIHVALRIIVVCSNNNLLLGA